MRLAAAAGAAALDITAAPAIGDGAKARVVISMKDVATGLTLVLRDPATGLPVARGLHRNRL